MTTFILITPYAAFMLGAAMLARAQHLYAQTRSHPAESNQNKLLLAIAAALMLPTFARAEAVDLRTATESGNAIIMYLSGTFAAIGIITAGLAMMGGRHTVAKWAFLGAMVCGFAFAVVKAFWSNMGLEAAGVSSFTQ